MINVLTRKVVALKNTAFFVSIGLLVASASVYALQSYSINNKQSEIGFTGEHVGMTFTGTFEKWEATMTLPPAENPSISASFDMGSAKTGDFTYDSTLPEGDWFDAENHPTGTFVSDSIELQGNDYEVTGKLTLRGISQAQTFVMEKSGEKLTAKFTINRLDYKIGFESDPNADWVSRDIMMSLHLDVK